MSALLAVLRRSLLLTRFSLCAMISYGAIAIRNQMDSEITLFLISVGVLILYLVLSALTEMGTKFPWK